jgi:hypothetical protein
MSKEGRFITPPSFRTDLALKDGPVQVEPETACKMVICDFCQQPMEVPKGKSTRDSKMCPSCEATGKKAGLPPSVG